MPFCQAKILIIDDEPMIRFAFTEFLKDEGHMPLAAENAEAAMELLHSRQPEIVFLDYRLPGKDGLLLLNEIRAVLPEAAVVFMTAFGAMDVAIKAMQMGAYEYLTKPLDLGRVRETIRQVLASRRSLEAAGGSAGAPLPGISAEKMVGRSPVMQEIFKMIGLLTTQDVTVLITGESGVGKELVARAIHDNSPRRDEQFVAINCGAMPDTLLEAEMFGYEKGAFTGADQRKIGKFELAGNGTVFLDEIGELHPALQVKLLRVLQERTFERVGGNIPVRTTARIMAATNRDLHEDMGAGRFRRDLYYRLHLVHITVPPLRERCEDIPLLVSHFIAKANNELGRAVRGVTEPMLEQFLRYPWPGNVRELENQIKRAMVLSRADVLSEELFELRAGPALPDRTTDPDRLASAARHFYSEYGRTPSDEKGVMDQAVAVVEKTLIMEALRHSAGNQVQAALLLGMHRSTLRNKIKEHGLNP